MGIDPSVPRSGLGQLGEELQQSGAALANMLSGARSGSTTIYNSQVERQYQLALGSMRGQASDFWATLEADRGWETNFQTYPKQFGERWEEIKKNALEYVTLPEAREKIESEFLEFGPAQARSVQNYAIKKSQQAGLAVFSREKTKAIEDGDEAYLDKLYDSAEAGEYLEAETLANGRIADKKKAHYNRVVNFMGMQKDPSFVLDQLNKPGFAQNYDLTPEEVKTVRDEFTYRAKYATDQQKAADVAQSDKIMSQFYKDWGDGKLDTLQDYLDVQNSLPASDTEKREALQKYIDRFKNVYGVGFEKIVEVEQETNYLGDLGKLAAWKANPDAAAKPALPYGVEALGEYRTKHAGEKFSRYGTQAQATGLLNAYEDAAKFRAEGGADPQKLREAKIEADLYDAFYRGVSVIAGTLDPAGIEAELDSNAISSDGFRQASALQRSLYQTQVERGQASSEAGLDEAVKALLDRRLDYEGKLSALKKLSDDGKIIAKDYLQFAKDADPWSKNFNWQEIGQTTDQYFRERLAHIDKDDANAIYRLTMLQSAARVHMQDFMAAHAQPDNPKAELTLFQDELNSFLKNDLGKTILVSTRTQGETFISSGRVPGMAREAERLRQTTPPEQFTGFIASAYETNRAQVLVENQARLTEAKVWIDRMPHMPRTVAVESTGETVTFDEYTGAGGKRYGVFRLPINEKGTIGDIVMALSYDAAGNLTGADEIYRKGK